MPVLLPESISFVVLGTVLVWFFGAALLCVFLVKVLARVWHAEKWRQINRHMPKVKVEKEND